MLGNFYLFYTIFASWCFSNCLGADNDCSPQP